jgi:hypothetical protein
MLAISNRCGATSMKKSEPEFDQWTDQNHVPYFPVSGRERQKYSEIPPLRRNFNMLWHSIQKIFGHPHKTELVKRGSASTFLS